MFVVASNHFGGCYHRFESNHGSNVRLGRKQLVISSYQLPTITSGVRDDSMIVRMFNRRRPIVKPTLSDDEYHALVETESLYTPSTFTRLLTTYFRSASGAGLHVGHSQYFDFGHISSKILGVAGLNSSYASQVYRGG